MQFTRQQIIFLSVIGVIILTFVLIVLGVLPGGKNTGGPKITLNLWGVDSEDTWRAATSGYRASHSNTRINYTQIDSQNYEKELINALAADKGPDIFMFNNHWLPRHIDKITPASEDKINLATFRELFPKVAEQDFAVTSTIYALPLGIDTLALVYNQDIFDNRRIALAPKTWDEFLGTFPRLRNVKKGKINTPIVASLGGSLKSVPDAADILNLLMFQFGAVKTDERSGRNSLDLTSGEAEQAVSFYTQFAFASPTSTRYIWSDAFKPSIDSFADGKTAMIFAYAHEIPEIKSKNPFLNFAVRPAPQIDLDRAVNVADYWGLAVSNKTQYQAAAWDFVVFAATDKDNAFRYGQTSGRPPALRSLINDYLNDPDLGAFTSQALTARSWYQVDDTAIKEIFNDMIKMTLQGSPSYEVVRQADAELRNLERGSE